MFTSNDPSGIIKGKRGPRARECECVGNIDFEMQNRGSGCSDGVRGTYQDQKTCGERQNKKWIGRGTGNTRSFVEFSFS